MTKAISELTLKEPRKNILKYIQWLGFHKVGKLCLFFCISQIFSEQLFYFYFKTTRYTFENSVRKKTQ